MRLTGWAVLIALSPNTPVTARAQSVATIFGPGVISTAQPEFGFSMTPDSQTVYFNVATTDRSRVTLVSSHYIKGQWQAPTPVSFASEYRDVDPFVTADGHRMYFSSNRPRTGTAPQADFDIWYAQRHGRLWDPPVLLQGPVNTDSNEVFTSLTRDGMLYFASNRGGNSDIYRVRVSGDGTGEPERLGPEINTDGAESNPAISPDGSFLVFAADRPGGFGGSDLYVSYRRGNGWTPAENLGAAVNSPQSDFAPYVSPDGKYLFFTSERPGIVPAPATGRPPGDIYRIELKAAGISPKK